jgi:hypothetical protein
MRRNIRLVQSLKSRIPLRAKAWAGIGAVAAGGLTAALLVVVPSAPSAQASVQANPVSAAMIRAMTTGNSTQVAPVAARAAADLPAGSAVSSAAADRSALAWLPRAGTEVLGESLAYVSTPRYGSHQLVWLVSIDPAGGLGSVYSGEADNFVVEVISAKTGQWLMTVAGKSPLLPALPAIAAR